jgi:hypothetical protein
MSQSEAENIERLVAVLRKVPAKSLLLIELANKIPIYNGVLDVDALAALQPDIELATAEAKMYGAYTGSAVDALSRLKGVG